MHVISFSFKYLPELSDELSLDELELSLELSEVVLLSSLLESFELELLLSEELLELLSLFSHSSYPQIGIPSLSGSLSTPSHSHNLGGSSLHSVQSNIRVPVPSSQSSHSGKDWIPLLSLACTCWPINTC